ncbi:MAG: outer membrane beta-barrel protein [Bacteroidetes bacterium]|nr:outer membrane beta-barrel protein [Bacteroidota bacterium]MBS1943180.1 outer membrane beta-barrel protein [Bacteroidota bacterium]
MKKITLGLAAFALAGSMMAQENRASLGLELGLPMGDFGDVYGFGVGGTLGFELPVGDNLGFMAQAGYITFSGKDISVGPVSVKADAAGMIPVQVGLKYYFTDNQEGFYAGLLTGLHMQSVKTASVSSSGSVEEKSEMKSNFGIAPLVGYIVGENIDIALRYQMIFAKGAKATSTGVEETTVTNSYLGVRVAYMFGGR